MLSASDRGLVGGTPGGVIRAFEQLPNVGAGAEDAGLGGLQDEQPHIGVVHRLPEQVRQPVPHRLGEGVTLRGPVDQQPGDHALPLQPQAHAGETFAKCCAISWRVAIHTSGFERTCFRNSSSAQMRPGRPIMRR